MTISVTSDPSLCLITSFKFYLSKLNKDTNFLWQKPKQSRIHYTDEVWYELNCVGKDLLNRFMKFLQKNIELEGNYTNHSICSTVITNLDSAGFEARHIITLSFHKNESTIQEYSIKCPDNKHKEMFDSLSSAIQSKYCKIKPKPTASTTVPSPNDKEDKQNSENQENDPDIDDIKQNLPQFSLQLMEDFETLDGTVLQDLLSDEFTDLTTCQLLLNKVSILYMISDWFK